VNDGLTGETNVHELLTSAPSRESFWERRPKQLNEEIIHRAAWGAPPVRVRIGIPTLDALRRVVSRSVAPEPWNFPAGCSIKGDRRPDLVKDSRDWIRVYRAGRWGTDMNGAFDQVALGLNIFTLHTFEDGRSGSSE
jgi:hypothetical protein